MTEAFVCALFVVALVGFCCWDAIRDKRAIERDRAARRDLIRGWDSRAEARVGDWRARQ